MKKFLIVIMAIIMSVLNFFIDLPKKYIDNAVKANLFGGPRRVTAGMSGSNETSLFVAGSLRRAWRNAGVPTNGTSGTYAGIAEAGDFLVDTTYKALYQNTGTQASPVWSRLRNTGPLTDKTASCYLTTAESGIVRVYTDNIYLYLPTYVGNQGLYFLIKIMATHSSGVKVIADTVSGGKIDGATVKTSGAQYSTLEIICTDVDWQIINAKGTWT